MPLIYKILDTTLRLNQDQATGAAYKFVYMEMECVWTFEGRIKTCPYTASKGCTIHGCHFDCISCELHAPKSGDMHNTGAVYVDRITLSLVSQTLPNFVFGLFLFFLAGLWILNTINFFRCHVWKNPRFCWPNLAILASRARTDPGCIYVHFF